MEVVTLQFGQKANYAGSHFWNFEAPSLEQASEEKDLGVRTSSLFKQLGPDRWEPRLLAFDLSGAFGSMEDPPEEEEEPEPAASSAASALHWGGGVRVQKQEPQRPHPFRQLYGSGASPQHNQFQQPQFQQQQPQRPPGPGLQDPRAALDSAPVRFWSDYLRTGLPASSQFALPGLQLGLSSFDDLAFGRELFAAGQSELSEDMVDRLRRQTEACDLMQGINVLVDTDSAWAGLAACYLEEVRDAYGTKLPIFTYALSADSALSALEDAREEYQDMLGTAQQRAGLRAWSRSVGLHLLAQQSSACVPVSLGAPRNPGQKGHAPLYSATARFAAALHSLTLPSRQDRGALHMHEMVQSLFPRSPELNVLHLSFSAPFEWGSIPEALGRLTSLSFQRDARKAGSRVMELARASVLRGVPATGPQKEPVSPDFFRRGYEAAVLDKDRVFSLKTQCSPGPLELPASFPTEAALPRADPRSSSVSAVVSLSSPVQPLLESFENLKEQLQRNPIRRARAEDSAVALEWINESIQSYDDFLEQQ